MSKTPVIVALLVALGFGVAAAIVLQREPESVSVEGEPALTLGAQEVASIEVGADGGSPALRIVRRDDGSWILRRPDAPPWPASAERVRSALRLMTEGVRTEPADSGDAAAGGADSSEPDAGATQVRLSDGDRMWALAIGQPRAGGLTPVRVTPPDGRAVAARSRDQLKELFEPENMLGWRAMRAMPVGDAEASRIDLDVAEEAAGEDLRLVRQEARWRLAEPIAARARAATAKRVVSTLRSAELAELLDDRAPEEADLGLSDGGVIELRIEDDRRVRVGDDFRTETLVARLVLGAEVALAGDDRYALLEGWLEPPDGEGRERLWGPLVASVPMPAIQDALPTVDACLSRRAIGFPKADLRGFRFESGPVDGAMHREAGQWVDGQSGAPVPTGQRNALKSLARVLCEVDAGAVRRKPVESRPLGTVEVESFEGERVRCRLAVHLGQEGASRALAIEAEGVWRVYEPTEGTESLIKWLGGGSGGGSG